MWTLIFIILATILVVTLLLAFMRGVGKQTMAYEEALGFESHEPKTSIEFADLKIGQHLWVLVDEELLMVAKLEEDGLFEVCGPWECGISADKCVIIELVAEPKGYETTKKYYRR